MTVEWTNDDVDAKAVTLLLLQNGRAFAEAESIFRKCTIFPANLPTLSLAA